MLNSSFSVSFRNVTEFVALVARIPGSPKLVRVFSFPSVIYGRKDGQHTVRVAAIGHKTETLSARYTEFVGIRADGTSVNLHVTPLDTYAAQVSWVRENVADFVGSDAIKSVRELRIAANEQGIKVDLTDAVDAINVIRHEQGLVTITSRPLRRV